MRNLHEHPGYVENGRINAFATTLTDVFSPNWRELFNLLNEVSTDANRALQLARDVEHGSIVAEVYRRLHNYVASAMSLVEHQRRLFRNRHGELVDEFNRRLAIVVSEPEVPFVQNLRNFSLHRSLPILGYSLTFTPKGMSRSEMELSTADLLAWDRWNSAMRSYIESHGERMEIRAIVRKHYELVYGLNAWLIGELQQANDSALIEANELIVAIEAELAGVDLATARLRLEEARRRATQRSSPPGAQPEGGVGPGSGEAG